MSNTNATTASTTASLSNEIIKKLSKHLHGIYNVITKSNKNSPIEELNRLLNFQKDNFSNSTANPLPILKQIHVGEEFEDFLDEFQNSTLEEQEKMIDVIKAISLIHCKQEEDARNLGIPIDKLVKLQMYNDFNHLQIYLMDHYGETRDIFPYHAIKTDELLGNTEKLINYINNKVAFYYIEELGFDFGYDGFNVSNVDEHILSQATKQYKRKTNNEPTNFLETHIGNFILQKIILNVDELESEASAEEDFILFIKLEDESKKQKIEKKIIDTFQFKINDFSTSNCSLSFEIKNEDVEIDFSSIEELTEQLLEISKKLNLNSDLKSKNNMSNKM